MTTEPERHCLRAWIDSALNDAGERRAYPVPLEAHVHGIGTDVERDLIPLWCLTIAARPRVVVELGTRRAVSTRTLADACQRVGAILVTVDPDPGCAPFLRSLPVIAFRCTGEQLYVMSTFPPGSVDVLFIDTDPHDYGQTMGWLDTWVERTLAPAGLAIFHDINAVNVDRTPRLDIQVSEALHAWVKENPTWGLVELRHEDAGGLGILRRADGTGQ